MILWSQVIPTIFFASASARSQLAPPAHTAIQKLNDSAPISSITSLTSSLRSNDSNVATSADPPKSFSLPPLSPDDIIATTVTGCSIIVPWATEYHWIFQTSEPTTAIPTNSAGTRVEIIKITTSMLEHNGEAVFRTTNVLVYVHFTKYPPKANSNRTFPTPFTAGADMYAGVSEHRRFTSFFTTIASLPQHTGLTFANGVPSQDPQGYFFKLRSTVAIVNSMTYFQSLYPDMAALRTCRATTIADPAFQPPGLVVNTQLAKPTLFTPAGPSTTAKPSKLGAFSTTLVATQTSEPFSGKPSALPDRTVASVPSARTTMKSEEAESSIPSSPQFSDSTTNSQAGGIQGAMSTVISSTSPVQTFSHRASHNPLSNEITLSASRTAIANTTNVTSTPYQLSSVSVVDGEVVVDGNTLSTGTTLILGSGSTITELAIKTNSAGRTVLFGNVTTTGLHSSDRISESASIPVSIPSAVPTSTSLPATSSTANSGAASVTGVAFSQYVHLWTAFWILPTLFI